MRARWMETGFFILLVVLTTLAFFGLIRGFLMPLFWAAVLAIVFQPLHRWWLEKTGHRKALASLLTIVTISLVVILPLGLLVVALSREALHFYERTQTGEIDLAAAVEWVREGLPLVMDWLESLGVDFQRLEEGLSGAAVGASGWIAEQALAIGQDALRVAALFLLMVYVLFFFLRDGRWILDAVIRVLPLETERERALLQRFASVSRATIGGQLLVAALQGAMGGVLFWILGIPGPVFWGAIMTILSFLPAVGASLVWAPAAVILAVTGSFGRAAILILAGALLIGLVDNVLRPILVGRYTQMPDFVILISTLGGLAAFGLSGVVVGPLIAAFFLTVWEMFGQELQREPSASV